jgi:hypothetical protein
MWRSGVYIYWVGSGLRFQKSSVTLWATGYILFHKCPQLNEETAISKGVGVAFQIEKL